MEYDIVVGICTRDCADTVENIVKVVDKTLTKYFSKYTSMIMCCDGFSKDDTKKVFLNTNTKNDKKFLTEKGKRCKGSAVRTVIEKAKELNFKVVLFIDGDLEKLKEDWIKKLITQVLVKENDFSIATYLTDKNDMLINNHIVYPLTKSLFNIPLRQPSNGECCLSRKLALKLIGNKFFPSDCSINLFMTLFATCEGYGVVEVKAGAKDHSSNTRLDKPEENVIPDFNQYLKLLISMMRYYKACIRKCGKHNIKKVGSFDTTRVRKVNIPINVYCEYSRNYISDEKHYVEELIRNLNKQSVTGLKVAWLNWLCIYFERTKNLSSKEAEKEVNRLVRLFVKNKEKLVL